MIIIGIILIILMIFVLGGLVSIDNKLDVMIKNQIEEIKVLKNSKK